MTRNVVRSFLCFRSARPKNGLARRPQSKTPHTLAWLCDELRESTRLRAPWKINQPPIPEEIMSEIGRIIDRGKWSLEALSVIGTRMLRNQLNREGVMVGRKYVRTRMARMGMEALYRKPGTSKKHPRHEMYPYLLRGLTINRATQVWALDTTYIPMANGFVSRTAVVDWVSRTVLAGKVAITLEACHAVEVLHEAFTRHGRLEMVNPDQGRQFNAQAFVHAVKEQGCQFSMDKRGAWTSTCRMKRMP